MQVDSRAVVVGTISGYAHFRNADLLIIFHRAAAGPSGAPGHVDADEFVVVHFVVADDHVRNGKVGQAPIDLYAHVLVVGNQVRINGGTRSPFEMNSVSRAVHHHAVADLQMAGRWTFSRRSNRPNVGTGRVGRSVRS